MNPLEADVEDVAFIRSAVKTPPVDVPLVHADESAPPVPAFTDGEKYVNIELAVRVSPPPAANNAETLWLVVPVFNATNASNS